MTTKIEGLAHIMSDIGINMSDENFVGTPGRFLSYLMHYTIPYNPKHDLQATFKAPVKDKYDHAMVVQTNIPYRAVCAHHLLPVLGTAHVGYIPRERVVGLSKLVRVVQGITHQMPSLQEDVGSKIVQSLMLHLNPLGAMCVINAEHGCMAARGIEECSVNTVTSSLGGVFRDMIDCREEFYKLVSLNAT